MESDAQAGADFRGGRCSMNARPSAIVIGAGIGGIAAAARLARNGYEVTVVEKNDRPGGRADQLLWDGHRFDTGPTLFLMPQVFEETYAALGERMGDHLDLRRIDPTYCIRFDDGSELALTADLIAMREQLEAIETGSFGGFLRYLAEGQEHYLKSMQHFVGRDFKSLFDYLNPRNLPLLFQLKALVKHYPNVGRYFDDPRLRAAFTFQNMYLGLSPFDAPATYSLLQYTELADGVWFPVGGMYRVVESLVEIAEANGVHFRYTSPVERIDVGEDRARGVVLEGGRRLTADVVVANADLPYVYRKLLPPGPYARRLERKKYTSSAIMFYWGVDRVYPRLGHHNVYLSGDYRRSFDRIFKEHSLPEKPSFYIHAPARTDTTAAPPGQDSLMALVPVGHLEEGSSQDWSGMQKRAREAVLDRLAADGMPDFRGHIKFEVSLSPHDWRALYNLEKGAAFGLSHNFAQVGYLRPRNQHDRYRNLFFVGASTHPGTGLPIVLMSARLTTGRILQEARQTRGFRPFSSAEALEAGGL
jgi:phytoene desaturase